MAACSTTRRNSRERSDSIRHPSGALLAAAPAHSGRRSVRGDRRLHRWEVAAGGAVGAIPKHIIGLHHLVNLAGALVDDRTLAIPVEAPDGVFVGVAVGAVHLHGIAGGTLRGDGCK